MRVSTGRKIKNAAIRIKPLPHKRSDLRTATTREWPASSGQNAVLEGELVKRIQERTRLGQVYAETVVDRDPPKNIVLTIDKTIQLITEQALAQGVANADARAGMAVVLDPTNGDILAIAKRSRSIRKT